MRAELGSLAEWLNGASATLGDAGVATPRYDAERLAAHVLGVRWGDLPHRHSDVVLDERVRKRLAEVLVRRARGEPLAYIEGSRGFYGLELACGPGVLVPRPETELLVDVALELIDGRTRPVVVDLGTGTGAVALAIAKERPDAEVVATDVSEDALTYARKNAHALQLDVWISSGDLFAAVPQELRGRIDLVVANPPYVRRDTELPADVTAEPEVALYGGLDGMDLIRRIANELPDWLAPGGAIALEIGDEQQADAVSEYIAGAAVRKDLNGRARVVWARS